MEKIKRCICPRCQDQPGRRGKVVLEELGLMGKEGSPWHQAQQLSLGRQHDTPLRGLVAVRWHRRRGWIWDPSDGIGFQQQSHAAGGKQCFVPLSVLKSPHLLLKQRSRFQLMILHTLGLGEICAWERQQEAVAEGAVGRRFLFSLLNHGKVNS